MRIVQFFTWIISILVLLFSATALSSIVSHHTKPLSQLEELVATDLSDLSTKTLVGVQPETVDSINQSIVSSTNSCDFLLFIIRTNISGYHYLVLPEMECRLFESRKIQLVKSNPRLFFNYINGCFRENKNTAYRNS